MKKFRMALWIWLALGVHNLSISQNQISKQVDDVTKNWLFVPGDDTETLHRFQIPDFKNAQLKNLPHRLTMPNSVFWYQKKIKVGSSKAILKLNADDGAQVWINHQRIKPNKDGNFPFKTISDSTEIIIRVLNNAVAGGLRNVAIFNHAHENIENEIETQFSITPLMSEDKNIHENEDAISFSFWGDSQGGWTSLRCLK